MSSFSITTAVQNNIWDNVSGPESSAGDVEYRCIYVYNNHATLTLQNAKAWLAQLTASGDDEIDIGLGTTAVGTGDEQLVGSEQTAPTGVTFSRPTTSGAGLVIGDIAPGQHKAIWIRRTVNAGASAYTTNNYIVQVDGESLG
jgi:hypothetical protein